MMSKNIVALLVIGLVAATQLQTVMAEVQTVYPSAILSFNERGVGAEDLGSKAADILFAELVANPNLMLVDRVEMGRTMAEQELNLSGMVGPNDAIKVGNLIGAKILITGSVIEVDRSLYLVARIIGTETSRVLGASVRGERGDTLPNLVEKLAQKVSETIEERASELVAQEVSQEDRLAKLSEAMPEGDRPILAVKVDERHVGRAVIDPAAETEITLFAKHVGFTVLDADTTSLRDADILVTGEGFSEFAMRRGSMVGVKARLEVKAVDRHTNEVLAIDRETTVVVDLTEQIAGKAALQQAAARIAERMLPKLIAN